MAGIFISYRRDDSDVAAGRLADDLAEIFGRDAIFRDVDTLEAGEDYTKALDHALDACQALIAVIGSRWASVTDDSGRRRLEDPQDWVLLELRRALDRGIRVIPVLISAAMPRDADVPADLHRLLQRQAVELSDRHWKRDVEALTQALERIPGIARHVPISTRPARAMSRRRALGLGLALALIATAGWFGWSYIHAPAVAVPTDLSQWVRIRDSGPEGSVAGLAVVTAMEASLARQGRPVTLSARYLYEKAKSIDRFGREIEGTDMSAALYVAETFGAPPEDRWPYIAGSRELPRAMTWQTMDAAAEKFRARTFRLAGVDEIPQQLAQGRTIVAAIQVTEGWMSDQAAKTGVIKFEDKDRRLGGHAVVIVGVDPAEPSIKFANSWGVGWGVDGFGTMSTKVLAQLVSAMWAIEVPSERSRDSGS